MKTLLNILLAASAILLVVMCYQSLMIPIDFNKEVARRDAVVIQRLKDVRTLQEVPCLCRFLGPARQLR